MYMYVHVHVCTCYIASSKEIQWPVIKRYNWDTITSHLLIGVLNIKLYKQQPMVYHFQNANYRIYNYDFTVQSFGEFEQYTAHIKCGSETVASTCVLTVLTRHVQF